ncbi:MAG TPA: DUF5696 domain-containing protein [Petrotogaceae bacterium]|nr:DUF5696 domain-containing protein [Petrotogaceae bacterium]
MNRRIIFVIIVFLCACIALSNFEKVYENDNYTYFFDSHSLLLRIEQKNGDNVWHTGIEQDDGFLNDEWQAFSSSGMTVEYMTGDMQSKKVSASSDTCSITVQVKGNMLQINAQFREQGFSVGMEILFNEQGFEVTSGKNFISESSDTGNRIMNLYFFPFFEAAIKSDNGYVFIPDGSGSIMKIGKSNAKKPYIQRVYGSDYGTADTASLSTGYGINPAKKIKIPVYGVVSQEDKKGFMSIVKQGDEYTEILAYPGGVITPYTWISARYIVRQMYKKFLDKKGTAVLVSTQEPYDLTVKTGFILLCSQDANYSSMAVKYREYLEENNMLSEKFSSEKALLRLDVMAAETRNRVIGKDYIQMTSLKELKEITGMLNGLDYIINIFGYSKDGYSQSFPVHLPVSQSFAGLKELKEFNLSNKNVFYMVDYTLANKEKTGFGADVAQNISKQFITSWGYRILSPEVSVNLYKNEQKKFEELSITNLSFRTTGEVLYSDYGKRPLSRGQAKQIISSSFNGAFYNPNVYLWKSCSAIFDIDTDSSGYIFEKRSVPFLQILLSGKIPCFSKPLNFTSDLGNELLKLVEFGVYPSFIITQESSLKLLETPSQWISSSEFSSWQDTVRSSYDFVNEALKEVYGCGIISHEIFENGISKTRYSNDVVIFVNYGTQSMEYGSIEVPARGYRVVKDGEI